MINNLCPPTKRFPVWNQINCAGAIVDLVGDDGSLDRIMFNEKSQNLGRDIAATYIAAYALVAAKDDGRPVQHHATRLVRQAVFDQLDLETDWTKFRLILSDRPGLSIADRGAAMPVLRDMECRVGAALQKLEAQA